MKRLGLVSLLALAWADPALAQAGPQLSTEPGAAAVRGGFVNPARVVPAPVPPAVTQIDPDVAPDRTLNTNVTPVGPIYTIDGGTRTGNNLFHSFATFNLAAGDTARWVHTTGNPLTVANVINRVTGGTPSQLFGTLDSTAIPNADFYFINPAGIVMGATAQVDVPAAAHFSTASELRFASGPAFSVAAPDGSTLNVAAPQAFGFIGNEGGILVSGVDPNFLPNAGVLTLTAGDIAIEDSVFDTGELVLAAVGATAAEVGIDGSLSGPLGGQLTVVNSSLNSTPGGGLSGGVTLAAGELFLGDFSNITSLSSGALNAGNVTVLAGTATLDSGSFISSDSMGPGNSGQVNVSVAGLLSLADGSFIASDTFDTGNAGGVAIVAGAVSLGGGSFITSNALGAGNGGVVDLISAGLLSLDGNSFISSDSSGTGSAGGVFITAGSALVANGSFISSDGLGDGNGGIVALEIAGQLTVTDFSFISSDTFGLGSGGGVFITAGDVDVFGFSYISSDALGQGQGGLVGVAVDGLLTLDLESYISADVGGSGFGGNVFVAAGQLDLTRGSFISADTLFGSTGDAGFVSIDAGELNLSESYISSDSRGAGDAGGVFVTAGDVRLDLSHISSDAFGDGDGGGVFLTAGNVQLDFNSYISSDAVGQGDGGFVDVEVAGLLSLGFGSFISSDVYGDGFGGGVSVVADRLVLQDFSAIRSNVQDVPGAAGDAGNVFVDVGTLEMSGLSSISSDTFGSGDAGSVTVLASNASLVDGSFISSDAVGQGNGGLVDVEIAGLLSLDFGSYISSDVYGDGFGGGVSVIADQLVLQDGSAIRSNVQDVFGAAGDAGNVFVDVRTLQMSGFSSISSDTFGLGDAGNVTVLAATASLADGSFISSDALGDGAGGIVNVVVDGQLTLDLASYISADVGGSRDAGDVFVSAGRLDLTRNSFISSDTLFGSTGNAGNVTVDAATLNLSESYISSDAIGDGNGGLVDVGAGNLSMADGSYISSDSFGAGFAGGVLVTADRAVMTTGAFISSNALGSGRAGGVFVRGGSFSLDASRIESNAFSIGNAGLIDIELRELTLANGSAITSEASFAGNSGSIEIDVIDRLALSSSRIGTNSSGSGNAGDVTVNAGSILLDNDSNIASAALPGSTGRSGLIGITTGDLQILAGSAVTTSSANPNTAGRIQIFADRVTVQGVGSRISSENLYVGGPCGATECGAGLIRISTLGEDAEGIFLRDGGTLSTNSRRGPAGNIELLMAPDTLLILEGRDNPGVIETSSGPGTGGVITISRPLAIISNGGRISALGQSGGANVLIDTPFFIASADRLNVVEVSGVLEFSSAISDVSAGTVNPDLTVLDASGVLRGQCSAQRSSGELSQFTFRDIGPYAPAAPPPTQALPPTEAPPPAPGGGGSGDCL